MRLPRFSTVAYRCAQALLCAWALGLAVAAFQLDMWRRELTQTLLQLNADAQFRARARQREAVDPEWYRRKALALLAATDRLHRDTVWTLFVPGSWTTFDDLEERVAARVAQEFGEIVVETIRRELIARAGRLTGVALAAGGADLRVDTSCQAAAGVHREARAGASPESLPEFAATADYVTAVAQLDAAVQSLLALQQSGGQPEQLRQLVAYALGADLPGALARSVQLFHTPDEASIQPALLQARLQWATRCTLDKSMAALHARLLNANALFALEQGIVRDSTGLFDAAARPAPFERTLERYRSVHALLQEQDGLLASGANAWMRHGALGQAYDGLLARIADTTLLGPQASRQLRDQSGAAFTEFRRRFEAAFGAGGEPGVVWVDEQKRFAHSRDRAALRDGLGRLLQSPFMQEGQAGSPASLAAAADEAEDLARSHRGFLEDTLPRFPASAQPAVRRLVTARLSELAYRGAYQTLRRELPQDAAAPIDAAAYATQREQVAKVQAALAGMGASPLGPRLAGVLDAEVQRRLAALHEAWNARALAALPLAELTRWQGAPAAPRSWLAGADIARLTRSYARRAAELLALDRERLKGAPEAAAWSRLEAELKRYEAQQSDSSLLHLERYAAAVAVDVRLDNCGERLAALAPAPVHDDSVAQLHARVHQGLVARCGEVRAQAASLPAPAAPSDAAAAAAAPASAACCPAAATRP